ncbi:MAG TPA: tetratricopeptide repeat protein, partial [Candidatus Saccharimonadia bacterium]|nr:tetratricopeptide repeat protein [Candidatus Saccharimonadia bacterium]
FEQSLEASPDFVRANAGLADTYLLQVDYGMLEPNQAAQLAEPYAVKAVTLDPQSGEAWATLGLLRVSVGQLDAARRSLEQAIELDPRYEMAPMWLASVYGRQGKFDEQRRVLEQALALNPLEPVINGNLAQLLAATGRHDEAVALLERVLAVTPDDDLLLRTLATTELQAGRLDRGVRAAARAHAIDASAPANVEVYGDALVLLEEFVLAERVLAPLPPGSRVAASARQVARFARGERTLEPTLDALADPLSRAPSGSEDDRELLSLAGAARLVAGDAPGAARLLGVAAGTDPDAIGEDPGALEPASLLVVALERLGEAELAAKWRAAVEGAGQQWIAAAGGGVNVDMARAMFASMRGDADAAVKALEAAYAAGFRERWRLSLDPRLARVADDPRVRALGRRITDDLLEARRASRK